MDELDDVLLSAAPAAVRAAIERAASRPLGGAPLAAVCAIACFSDDASALKQARALLIEGGPAQVRKRMQAEKRAAAMKTDPKSLPKTVAELGSSGVDAGSFAVAMLALLARRKDWDLTRRALQLALDALGDDTAPAFAALRDEAGLAITLAGRLPAGLAKLERLKQLQLSGTLDSDANAAELGSSKGLRLTWSVKGDALRHLAPGAAGIEELICPEPSLKDLSALARFSSLAKLDLRGSKADDLAPLARLTGLRELAVNSPKSLAPLATLDGLTSLIANGVSDLAPLAGLRALRTLSVGGPAVVDLAPLASLTRLEELSFDGTGVTDLRPLAGMTAMRRLRMTGARVTDLSPLAGMRALEELDLSGTAVQDASPLAKLAALRQLDLGGTKVSDVAPLVGLANMTVLKLGRTAVANAAPLAGLSRLTELDLGGAPVTDVSPLGALKSLKFLTVNREGIPDEAVAALAAAVPGLAVSRW